MNHDLLIDGPRGGTTVILAHGAGAGMESDFMTAIAAGLADCGLRVVRFEFAYMAERRRTGKKRPPSQERKLRAEWLEVIATNRARPVIIGGKSMGGRIASLIADESEVDGLVCLGYPFHPAGKPDKLRIDHFGSLTTPTLIVQGERDALGNRKEVSGYGLPERISVCWLPDGDHSFKPRKASGRTLEENLAAAVEAVQGFVQAVVH